MPVAGNLGTMSISELLQWIAQGRKTGTLQVTTGDGNAQIAFDAGAIVFSASSRLENALGRLLIKKGVLTEEAHDRALELRAKSGIALGKVLHDLNLVREDEILQMMKLKAEDEIYGIFLCQDGEFRFIEQLPELELLPLRIDVTKAVLKVSQRLDEGEDFDFDSSGTHHKISH